MAKDSKPPRMTRAQIAEGLDQIPLDTILLGTRTESRLTAKQREFARNLALGKSKAQSYREAYKSKGTKKTDANEGYKKSLLPEVDAIKTAYELAIQAAEQRTPAQLRELVIHRLTVEALDGDAPPAARIAALKLLGTVSEVAAFTERKETTHIRKSEDVRAALMEKLKTISSGAVDGVFTDKTQDADSLLAEIGAGRANLAEENAQTAAGDDPAALDPTLVPPPSMTFTTLSSDLHSVPHSQPLEISNPHSQASEISAVTDNCTLSAMGDIEEGEIIGVDVHVSTYIEEIEPIVAEKEPAGHPTPSDTDEAPVKGT